MLSKYYLAVAFALASVACLPEHAPLSAGSPPAPSLLASPSSAAPVDAAAPAYTHDVWLVDTPPPATFLLAGFDEAPGDACEERLRTHARDLGANRLYIERDKPCAARAYLVRSAPTSERGTLRAQRGGNDELAKWLHARWKRPASVTARDAEHLCVVVQFSVSPMRRVYDVRAQPIQSSGNHDFDESVRAALESAITEHADVPAPPDDLVGEHVSYRIAFTDGDPQTACSSRK